ncbi:hypothetical protein H839_02631 [Parageobacillus genomosp. 1]|uniref:Uncharacterized protein n=1 Tax=Parageobacillus genomosp. 1 TaxID=1295642 RepID=A0ABC9VIY5_9BACL|nr:hypothetical protein H839_02631 [Parageobacillus genomosp. 1]
MDITFIFHYFLHFSTYVRILEEKSALPFHFLHNQCKKKALLSQHILFSIQRKKKGIPRAICIAEYL